MPHGAPESVIVRSTPLVSGVPEELYCRHGVMGKKAKGPSPISLAMACLPAGV